MLMVFPFPTTQLCPGNCRTAKKDLNFGTVMESYSTELYENKIQMKIQQ